ncbi:MAG: PD-(D/E)XK nuclease family protein [Anaerolineae bacterium]|jgi:ATP-dependent helicase/DNAse subunit B|nr:PD-(D/E)XK nuclease family protein [Anaerolineae bacterium]
MLEIVLAPVGSGKTERAIQSLTDTLNRKPLARIWILLATRRQEEAFRQRLIEVDDGRNLYFNLEFFNFYDLYRRLLNMALQPARGISPAARIGILRIVIQRLIAKGELTIYAPIGLTPGFVRIVAALIEELKQNRVYPTDFQQAAITQRDQELAAIYSGYQLYLQQQALVDRDGEGWLALTQFDQLGDFRLDLLLVDGYDQFTPVQADLLYALSNRAAHTLITLTTVPEREATIGRRFRLALETLRERFGDDLEITRLERGTPKHPDIQHLIESVFRPNITPQAAQGAIALIEAPDIAAEVAAALRQVKTRLIEGVRPDDLMIALRDWPRYQPHLITYGREYQIPLALHYGESLTENPAITALTDLLSLPESEFRAQALLDVLRSPYIRPIGLDDHAIALLDAIRQRFSVIKETQIWLDAVQQAPRNLTDEDRDLQAPITDTKTADALELALNQFFQAITPPTQATIEQYVAWVDQLIGPDPNLDPDPDLPAIEPAYHLDMIAAIREADEPIQSRDLSALHELKKVLRGMLTTDTLLAQLDPAHGYPVAWETFWTDLRIAIGAASINSRPNRGGRVLVTTAADARGLPHRHIVIMGLSEGIFPAPVAADPLYLDSERKSLRSRHVLLKTQAELATDDGLFYELICLARDGLLLTRPTAQNGQPWSESHLWRAVKQVYLDPPIQRIRAGSVVPIDQAASRSEAALALADHLSQHDTIDESTAGAYGWLLEQEGQYWQQIQRGRGIEMTRLTGDGFNTYSGQLETAELITRAAQTTGLTRLWSASQLNEYGACGFRFFAKRLLKLEPLKPPEEGMDSLQSGSLNHTILDQTYQGVIADGYPIAPEYLPQTLERMEAIAADVLRDAPEQLGFRPTALWQQEQKTLLQRLRRLITLDFSPENEITKNFQYEVRYPYRLEAPFGRDGAPMVTIQLGDGAELRLNGYIDRIDRIDDRVIVMDYKTGTTKFKVDEMSAGRNFQMILYLIAAQTLIAHANDGLREVAGGFFWHIRNGTISGKLDQENADTVTSQAIEKLGHYLHAMQTGDFSVNPSQLEDGKCTRYCEYRPLCRMCGLHSIA